MKNKKDETGRSLLHAGYGYRISKYRQSYQLPNLTATIRVVVSIIERKCSAIQRASARVQDIARSKINDITAMISGNPAECTEVIISVSSQ